MCTSPLNLSDRTVKCGQCKSCLLEKSATWSARLTEEFKESTSAYFVTLTYRDQDALWVDTEEDTVTTLSKRDVQLFMKKLRKFNEKHRRSCDYPIRYYLTGEYGGKFGRAHYHILLFNATKEASDRIHQIWDKGRVDVQGMNEKAIRYVSNYMLTKNIDVPEGIEKPFSLMSRRPGLGAGYIGRNWKHHYDNPEAIHMKTPSKKQRQLPRYYADKLISDTTKKQFNDNKEKEFEARRKELYAKAEKACPEDPLGWIREERKRKSELHYKRKLKNKKL